MIIPLQQCDGVVYCVVERGNKEHADTLRKDGWQCVFSHHSKDVWFRVVRPL